MRADIDEALRYAGVRGTPPEALRREMERVAGEVEGRLAPRWVWRVWELDRGEGGIALRGTEVTLTGRTAERMLADCRRAALMVCTAGAELDALLRAWQARDMARAVLLDGYGSALAEAACDAAEREIGARFAGAYLTDRFSPGYGDLPLALQPAVCAALDAARRAGVRVTDSLLLSPAKSVTAVVGLADRPQAARIRGCDYCGRREDCALRKGGERCGI